VAHLYGNHPDVMGEATAKVAETGRFVGIDLNAGCPVHKVMGSGAGAALIKTPELFHDILAAMVKATQLPVTVKTRLGPAPDKIAAFELLAAAESAGAKAITIHGRFTSQRHSGAVHHDLLAEVKQRARIPVIINGGIYSSCEHIVYVTGNADFYDCVFVNENRSLYSGLDSAYCVYFGLDRCPENAVCNFYSCRFGSEHYTDNLYGTALVATNNYGYRAPRDVHLYDCAVYGGTSSFFSYNYPSASNLADTRFYLHGSTRLYERGAANSEVTKETLAASVASWKTKPLLTTARRSPVLRALS